LCCDGKSSLSRGVHEGARLTCFQRYVAFQSQIIARLASIIYHERGLSAASCAAIAATLTTPTTPRQKHHCHHQVVAMSPCVKRSAKRLPDRERHMRDHRQGKQCLSSSVCASEYRSTRSYTNLFSPTALSIEHDGIGTTLGWQEDPHIPAPRITG
jgi:hypothetical protein